MRLFGMAASPSRRLPAILSVYLVISIALTLPHNTGAQNKAPDKKGKDSPSCDIDIFFALSNATGYS